MIKTKDRFLKFIEEFKASADSTEIEKCFTKGNCYHFALILSELFGGKIYHIEISNHFITKIYDEYYDITGKVDVTGLVLTEFDTMQAMDKAYYHRLIRDGVYLESSSL